MARNVRIDHAALRRVMQPALERAMAEGGQWLAGKVKVAINRGNRSGRNPSLPGEPPKKVTGALFKSIATDGPTTTGNVVRIRIGTNLVYGRALELGFRGTVTVRPHMRGSRRGRKRGRAPVGSYSRMMALAARPYLGPTLRTNRAAVQEVIMRALRRNLARSL